MADFGMLFRKDEIVNRVASPTKFSEYALCGLPVLISDNIGDFSNFIKETGFGYVISNNEHIEDECDTIAQYIADFKIERPNIAAFSKNKYSKQAQANRLLKIYQEI
jgi:glycosyltransferase involved in cell wall biosynthesis